MARAASRPVVASGLTGALTDHVAKNVLDASAKMLGITDPERRRQHDERLYDALTFYRERIEQQTEIMVREEIHRVADALLALQLALRPINPRKPDKSSGISGTAVARIARAMRQSGGGVSKISLRELIDALALAHIDIEAIDEIGRARHGGSGKRRPYTSPALALNEMGAMLAELYERCHPSRVFVLGVPIEPLDHVRGNKAGSETFTSPAFKWFARVIRGMVPGIKDSQIRTAAKEARKAAGWRADVRMAHASYYLALVYFISGDGVPDNLPPSEDAATTFLDWLYPRL
jgi:hypothetical protein